MQRASPGAPVHVKCMHSILRVVKRHVKMHIFYSTGFPRHVKMHAFYSTGRQNARKNAYILFCAVGRPGPGRLGPRYGRPGPRYGQKRSQKACFEHLGGLGGAPRGPGAPEGPRRPQKAPEGPRRPQKAPGRPQKAPERPQEAPEGPGKGPRRPQERRHT